MKLWFDLVSSHGRIKADAGPNSREEFSKAFDETRERIREIQLKAFQRLQQDSGHVH